MKLKLKSKIVSLKKYDNNGESHYQGNVHLMAYLRKHLEVLHPRNRGLLTSTIGENPTPTRAGLPSS